MHGRTFWCWSAGLCLLAGACGLADGGSRARIERADSAGLEVVRVLGAPSDTLRPGSPALRIGSAGVGGAEHEVFELLTDAELLPGGRIAIVDNRGARVAVFDSAGEWLYDIGRRGEGPGEHTGPIRAAVRGDTLFVWDVLQRRMSRYTSAGDFLGATTLPRWRGVHAFAVIEGGYVHDVESGQLTDPAPARGALVRASRDGGGVDTLVGPYPVPEYGAVMDEASGMVQMTNPPALAIAPPWTVAAGRVFRLDPTEATVEVRELDTGRRARIIRLPYDAAPPTEAEKDGHFRGLQAQYGLPDDAVARMRAATEFAALRPPVAGVAVDDRGRVWVAEHDPAARTRDYIGPGWDVIDVGREEAARVEFPAGFELQVVHGGRAFGITTLATGVHVVDMFRLNEDSQLSTDGTTP